MRTNTCNKCADVGILHWRNHHPYGNTVAIEDIEEFCDCMAGTRLELEESFAEAELEEEENPSFCPACYGTGLLWLDYYTGWCDCPECSPSLNQIDFSRARLLRKAN